MYYTYNRFMQQLFGCRVYKVSVDANFSCPNRDGTLSTLGCIFCDELGSSSRTHDRTTPIRDQILNNIKVRKARYRAQKFIVYFQSFSNTYGSLEKLKDTFDKAAGVHPDIIGISISTRPDCVDEEKIKLIASYKKIFEYVSIEYGMQTIHNKTLKFINRQETHADFLNALQLTKKYDLHHVAHVILGLPNETVEDQMETAQKIKEYEIEGIKIHLLVAMQNTALAKMYEEGLFNPLSFEEYIKLACSFLERLGPKCVIHRISASGHPLHIVAPLWMKDPKLDFEGALLKEFARRGTFQGIYS
jgi:uncharacterized protein